MMKRRRETRYISVLTVHVPDIQGLIDMLRYERCCPLDEDESRKLTRLIAKRDGGLPKDQVKPIDHVIRLLRFATANVPPSDRWQSFHCRVLDERSPDVAYLSDEEALTLAKESLKKMRGVAR